MRTRTTPKAGAVMMASDRQDVEALIAATDTMALGAISAVRAIGLVPGADIAVAGFDDVVDADDVTPGLTSVNLALESVGAAVVEMATSAGRETHRADRFEARVVLRDSTLRRR